MRIVPALILTAAAVGQINFYSLEREIALGDSLADQFRQIVTTSADPRLNRIGVRLAAQTTRFQYRFFVFDGGTASADDPTAIPGGWIFVPRHLLARDDAQLAAILAHAIGHVDLRHATRAMTRQELTAIGLQMVPVQPGMQMELAMRKLDRSFELAADLYAVQLLHKAGFDPSGLVIWLHSLPPPAKIAFSPYPAPDQRAAAAEKAIAELAH
jgi:predicted Zn-dependent protease